MYKIAKIEYINSYIIEYMPEMNHKNHKNEWCIGLLAHSVCFAFSLVSGALTY